MKKLALFGLLLLSSTTWAESNNSLPELVNALLDRSVACHNWQQEAKNYPERNAEINESLTEYRCKSLAADQTRMLKKYANNPEVVNAIKAVKNN